MVKGYPRIKCLDIFGLYSSYLIYFGAIHNHDIVWSGLYILDKLL